MAQRKCFSKIGSAGTFAPRTSPPPFQNPTATQLAAPPMWYVNEKVLPFHQLMNVKKERMFWPPPSSTGSGVLALEGTQQACLCLGIVVIRMIRRILMTRMLTLLSSWHPNCFAHSNPQPGQTGPCCFCGTAQKGSEPRSTSIVHSLRGAPREAYMGGGGKRHQEGGSVSPYINAP